MDFDHPVVKDVLRFHMLPQLSMKDLAALAPVCKVWAGVSRARPPAVRDGILPPANYAAMSRDSRFIAIVTPSTLSRSHVMLLTSDTFAPAVDIGRSPYAKYDEHDLLDMQWCGDTLYILVSRTLYAWHEPWRAARGASLPRVAMEIPTNIISEYDRMTNMAIVGSTAYISTEDGLVNTCDLTTGHFATFIKWWDIIPFNPMRFSASSDGRWIATTGYERADVTILDIGSAQVVCTLRLPQWLDNESETHTLAWEPGGGTRLAVGWHRHVVVWDVATHDAPRMLVEKAVGCYACCAWSPDGKTLACVIPTHTDPEIHLVSMVAGPGGTRVLRDVKAFQGIYGVKFAPDSRRLFLSLYIEKEHRTSVYTILPM